MQSRLEVDLITAAETINTPVAELIREIIGVIDQAVGKYKAGEITDLELFGRVYIGLGSRVEVNPELRELIEAGIREREQALEYLGVKPELVRARYFLTRNWAIERPSDLRGKEGPYLLDKLEGFRSFLDSLL